MTNQYFYITVLSNWLLGYDRYQRVYSKALLPKSSFPNEFYLLKETELQIGEEKASALLSKLNIPDNCLIKIETSFAGEVQKNERNGRGWVIQQNFIQILKVYIKTDKSPWEELSVEEITAKAFLLSSSDLKGFSELKPRTLSILPVGLACQARCWFCFSESSISVDQEKFTMDLSNLDSVCKRAKEAGAERFVITGGGEPGLLKFNTLLQIVKTASGYFNKMVMITNGLFLSTKSEDVLKDRLEQLIDCGLSILCISKHSHDPEVNKEIMGIDTNTDRLLGFIQTEGLKIKKRLICVLQKMGVCSPETISSYLDYATSFGVEQVCFKELYVASTLESLYSKSKENGYSQSQQVGLNVVLDFMKNNNFTQVGTLPWGSPVFEGIWKGKSIQIAAYTEPSVGWERLNCVARSWNLMSDGKCYASLEDPNSLIEEKE